MSGHRIHPSTTERGYAASCICGWRVVRDRQSRRDAEAQQHVDSTRSSADLVGRSGTDALDLAAGPTRPPARYVCREHPDQAVTWRGTGCPDCETRSNSQTRAHRERRVGVDDVPLARGPGAHAIPAEHEA